jgi:hypothetical protein
MKLYKDFNKIGFFSMFVNLFTYLTVTNNETLTFVTRAELK